MRDLLPPAVASNPVEAIEIVSLAISDGDLETALAQYERSAILQPWQHSPGETVADPDGTGADPDGTGADPDGSAASGLRDVMDLRLPLALHVLAVVPADGLVLVLAERRISGAGPDCEDVNLTGSGAAVVRRQAGGGWRIVADAWRLAGTGAPGVPRDSP